MTIDQSVYWFVHVMWRKLSSFMIILILYYMFGNNNLAFNYSLNAESAFVILFVATKLLKLNQNLKK